MYYTIWTTALWHSLKSIFFWFHINFISNKYGPGTTIYHKFSNYELKRNKMCMTYFMKLKHIQVALHICGFCIYEFNQLQNENIQGEKSSKTQSLYFPHTKH